MSTYRINLAIDLPSRSHQRRRRSSGLTLSEALRDPFVLSALVVLLLAAASVAIAERRTSSRLDLLVAEVSGALGDSTRFEEDIYLADGLRARQAETSAYLDVLSRIDRGRFVWAHLMDEFATLAPANVWLKTWRETGTLEGTTGQIQFEVGGYAASTQVLSDFIEALESSPFIADMSFANTESEKVAGQDVIEFTIRGSYEEPDPTLLEMEEIGPDGRTLTAPEPPADMPLLPEGTLPPSPRSPSGR